MSTDKQDLKGLSAEQLLGKFTVFAAKSPVSKGKFLRMSGETLELRAELLRRLTEYERLSAPRVERGACCGCSRDDHWIGFAGNDVRNCKNALTCGCSRPPDKPMQWERLSALKPIDGKFGISGQKIVNLVSGEAIPDDEPLFLLRARDHHALELLTEYRHIASTDCNDLHLAGIQQVIDRFFKFAVDHYERMKQPGVTRHLKLDSALVAGPRCPKCGGILGPVLISDSLVYPGEIAAFVRCMHVCETEYELGKAGDFAQFFPAERQEAGWVKCSERLPEYGTVSIVFCHEDDGLPWQDIATYSYYSGWYIGSATTNREKAKVTHWCPLPAPPNDGGGATANWKVSIQRPSKED